MITPSGTTKIGLLEYQVEMNSAPRTVADLNDIPIKTIKGSTIYMRDVAHVRDGFSPQTNIVRQDGVHGVLMSMYKIGKGSTITIVNAIKGIVPIALQALPKGITVKPLFDQSLFVRASINGVLREGLIAAALTACMILLFLGDWRPTIVISISIPLSIFVSVLLLSALGETINIMTLGGLALAVGILVDDATVEIENIERNLAQGKEMKQAILDGASQIAVPAFVSTLSICIVFVPMFFLTGVARFLFVPLAEAVVFAMLASYFLSRTLIPTLVMYIMRGHEHREAGAKTFFGRYQRRFERGFEKFRCGYYQLLETTLEHRKLFAVCFVAFCAASMLLVFFLGEDFFPSVDAGQMRLHVRGRAGLRVEETARLCDEIEQYLRQQIPKDELVTILDNIGLPNSGINLSYSNSGVIGTSDAEILVGLNQEHHHPTANYIRKLREELPRQFPGVEFFFQPADIVTQILNFGLPAPIDIQLIGPDMATNYDIAQQISNRLRRIPGTADVHVQQLLDLPTLHLDIERTRIAQVGMNARDVAQSVLVSLSGSFQTAPNFWLNPNNGVSYQVAVQSPQYRMTSLQDLMNTPVNDPAVPTSQVLGNLVQLTPVVRPAVVSHYNVQPVIDVYASTQDRDLGSVIRDVDRELKPFRQHLPRGTQLIVRGQVVTMVSSFIGLGVGLLAAIVLVYFLIVVNFQSWLDPFIIITALPGALAGICWILLLTHTTLNVPSLTGAVMCMGVATANSILMISFSRDRMRAGIPAAQAALEAGYTRIRPVLMTALAMIIGMLPMSLGLGRGRRAECAPGTSGHRRVTVRHSGYVVLCSDRVCDDSRPQGSQTGGEAVVKYWRLKRPRWKRITIRANWKLLRSRAVPARTGAICNTARPLSPMAARLRLRSRLHQNFRLQRRAKPCYLLVSCFWRSSWLALSSWSCGSMTAVYWRTKPSRVPLQPSPWSIRQPKSPTKSWCCPALCRLTSSLPSTPAPMDICCGGTRTLAAT